MSLHSAFTEMFGIPHPVALAPMGGSAGGALAAAVSEGGGLGLVGGGREDAGWLDGELALAAARTARPWGAGFLSWAATPAAVDLALGYRPAAVMLAFGDLRPLAPRVLAAGVRLIVQVTDLSEARDALDAGADVIVAQGTEAGGHSGRAGRSTMAFVPVVADLAAPAPVLAAGGIADGRGVAAALALGAAGVLIGTRFLATPETLIDPSVTKAIVAGTGEDTERSSVLDIVRDTGWPAAYLARTLRHPLIDQWRGREAELAADAAARQAYQEAVSRGDLPPVPAWASQAIDLITDVRSAADLVGDLARDAELALSRIGRSG